MKFLTIIRSTSTTEVETVEEAKAWFDNMVLGLQQSPPYDEEVKITVIQVDGNLASKLYDQTFNAARTGE